jgi:hypothetical protein
MNFEGSTVGKISGRENDIAVLRAEYGLKQLKKGIWVYFLLLLFEGACVNGFYQV